MSLDGIQLVYFSIFCGELLKFKENSVEFLKVYKFIWDVKFMLLSMYP